LRCEHRGGRATVPETVLQLIQGSPAPATSEAADARPHSAA
jgi:hypothetical protein